MPTLDPPLPETIVADDPNAATISAPASVDEIPISEGAQVEVGTDLLPSVEFSKRYVKRTLLGKGGMGEVRLCKDQVVGRSVAMKLAHSTLNSRADIRTRFLCEAQIQGQLEHPSIVPVYDLGKTPEGELYFTMKRIGGISLRAVVLGLRAGNAEIIKKYSRRRLLSAFSNICLAIDFAHQRGVLHRDLKPPNVMFGNFGEVYLLDWGVAKVLGTAEPAQPSADGEESGVAPTTVAQTEAGAITGTPGYIAPELLYGKAEALSPRTDVYSLGVMLFEILALEPLYKESNRNAILYAALQGRDARPSVRRPDLDIPPELDAICVKATAKNPSERFTSARALHEAVEQFLDGDRDLELRRQLATAAVRSAEESARQALTGQDSTFSQRKRALREVGRALALAPENPAAMRTLVSLLEAPPQEVPKEVQQDLAQADQQTFRFVDSTARWLALILNLMLLPLGLWMGIRNGLGMAIVASVVTIGTVVHIIGTRNNWSRRRLGISMLVTNALTLGLITRTFGPFMLTPMTAMACILFFSFQSDRTLRKAALIAIGAAVTLVVVLESAGVLPNSHVFHHGRIEILPQFLYFPEIPTIGFLLMSTLGGLFMAYSLGRFRDALTDSEQRVKVQAWQLRQLVTDNVTSAHGAS